MIFYMIEREVSMIFYKEKFRQLRESRGLTHEEIGAACGVSQSIVSRWEKKGKSQPKPAKIKKIAAIMWPLF